MKVKIKTWDKMEEEFGLDPCDDINCNSTFVSSMEEEMPEDRVIEVIKSGNSYHWTTGENEWELIWEISDDMIEQVIIE